MDRYISRTQTSNLATKHLAVHDGYAHRKPHLLFWNGIIRTAPENQLCFRNYLVLVGRRDLEVMKKTMAKTDLPLIEALCLPLPGTKVNVLTCKTLELMVPS
jgi:hypothetical protein